MLAKCGEGPWEEAEKLQREVGRLILGVPARTANEVVLGDLGWWELKTRRDKARLKLLKKLRGLEGEEYARILVNDKNCIWGQYTDRILDSLSVANNDIKLYDEKGWRRLVTQKMQQKEEMRWHNNMMHKSKLRTYRRFKKKLGLDPYLDFESRGARCVMSRLRSGTNFLRVETGRYEDEKVEDRLCLWCNKVEDEEHFLIDCELYEDIRANTWKKLNVTDTRNKTELLKRLLGSVKSDKNAQVAIVHHIMCSRKLRDRFVALL